jgi:hypothetical protein
MEGNGKERAEITVSWDEATQGVEVKWTGLKSLDMVCATLAMAKQRMEFELNMARMAAMQQQAAEAQRQMAIRHQLKL